jgi:hypothetical protein
MTMPKGPGNPLLSRQLVLRLQRTSGNQAVRRMLARQAGAGVEMGEYRPSAAPTGGEESHPSWRAWLSRLFGRGQPIR